MKLSFVAVSASVLLTLGGCATTSSSSSTSSRVDADNLDILEGKKEIYIGHMGVTFITQDKSSSKATSPMIRHSSASDYAQAVLTAKLSGVPQQTMQAIADKSYTDLVKDLQAKGFVVRDYADLRRQSKWSTMDALEQPYSPSSSGMAAISSFIKRENTHMVTYAPSGMELFLAPTMSSKNIEIGKMGEVAEGIGKPVLLVSYTVHFAYFDNDADYSVDYFKNVPAQGGPSETLSASVTLGQGIQVIAGSGIDVVTEGLSTFSANGAAKLKDPVIVAGAYGTNEDTTSGATKAANMFSSAVGFLSGGSTEHKEISVVAVPEYFEFGALKALNEANTRLVDALVARQ